MKTALRIASLFVALITAALWFFGGMNTGWTKTSQAVKTIDAVTGLDAVTWETRFLPGVDFLGAGLLLALVLWAVSVFVRKPGASAA